LILDRSECPGEIYPWCRIVKLVTSRVLGRCYHFFIIYRFSFAIVIHLRETNRHLATTGISRRPRASEVSILPRKFSRIPGEDGWETRGGKREGRKRNEQWQRAWVHGADRTGCTCRCIGSGGQTGIRAVAPAHLPHPLVAGRRITVPPLPPGTQALCF